MGEWLKVYTAFEVDQFGSHVRSLTIVCTSISRISDSLFWILKKPVYKGAYLYKDAYIYA